MCFALWPTEDTHMHDELWEIDYVGVDGRCRNRAFQGDGDGKGMTDVLDRFLGANEMVRGLEPLSLMNLQTIFQDWVTQYS